MYDIAGSPMSCHPMFGILAVCRARGYSGVWAGGGSDRRCVLVHRATFLFKCRRGVTGCHQHVDEPRAVLAVFLWGFY